jgi:hypothetical protein
LVALAGRTTGYPAAAIICVGTALAVAQELSLRAGLCGNLIQTGGGRTSKDGAPKEAFEYLATRKPSGERTRKSVEAPVVHFPAS